MSAGQQLTTRPQIDMHPTGVPIDFEPPILYNICKVTQSVFGKLAVSTKQTSNIMVLRKS
jgi:hypothetical protein